MEKREPPHPAESPELLRCFLIEHGEFYGKEITNGIVFIPGQGEQERKLAESIKTGDLFLHDSPLGISAVGKAVSMPNRVPFPAWRYRECRTGERGYLVEAEIFLLSKPFALGQKQEARFVALPEMEVREILRRILETESGFAGAKWFLEICSKYKI